MSKDSKPQVDPAAAGQITPIIPPWMANAKQVMMPEAMPGQLGGLARDMSMGGFGSKAADLAYLKQMYNPVPTMQFGMPPQTKPTVKPVTKPVTPPGPGTTIQPGPLGGGGFQFVDGKWVPVAGGAGSGGRNGR